MILADPSNKTEAVNAEAKPDDAKPAHQPKQSKK